MLTGASWSTTSFTALLRPPEVGGACFGVSVAAADAVDLGGGVGEGDLVLAPPPIKSLTSL